MRQMDVVLAVVMFVEWMQAQIASDSAAIRVTALNYVKGGTNPTLTAWPTPCIPNWPRGLF